MVGPIADEERLSFLQKVKVGFVALVALSGGLITLQAGADPVNFAGGAVAGAVAGALVVRVAFPSGEALETDRDRGESRDWGWEDDESEQTADREPPRQRR